MKYYLLLLLISITLIDAYSQSIITTESGRRISVNEDGTWEYISNDPDALKAEVNSTTMDLIEDNSSVTALESPSSEEATTEATEVIKENKLLQFEEELTNLYLYNRSILDNNLQQEKVLKEEISLIDSQEEVIYADKEELQASLENIEDIIKTSSHKVKESDYLLSKILEVGNEKEERQVRERIKKLLNITAYNTPAIQLTIEDFYFERAEYRDPDFCQLIFDDYDESLKKNRKETASRFFFSYTHPKLRTHFKDKDFLNCNASLAKLDKNVYLQLNIKIASKDARKNYGAIEQGAMLRIELIDGDVLYTTCMFDTKGKIEKYTGNTEYSPIYKLDKDMVKQLNNLEVDKIGLLWTSGYEDYEIYEVDFLKNQLSCLEK